jgi:hypothetical protein
VTKRQIKGDKNYFAHVYSNTKLVHSQIMIIAYEFFRSRLDLDQKIMIKQGENNAYEFLLEVG